MKEENRTQGTAKELYLAFSHPISLFFKKIIDYIFTALAVLSFKKLPDQIEKPTEGFLKDVNYSVATFEFLLLFVFIAKLFEVGVDAGELMESFRDIFVLILFFVCLLIFIGISHIWRYLSGIQVEKRIVDAFFIYEFNFLFLPSYLIMYPIYLADPTDDDAIGGMAVILGLFWIIHMAFYFVKLCRLAKAATLATIATALIMPLIGFTLLFISVFSLIGASMATE